ncbi:MAG TPA: RDD family protein [Thermoplasmata archaeon]|nr:RDD family protein [Thermoplasmata archaeon]
MDPEILALDVLTTSISLAIPALLWLFLYLVAWEDPGVALPSGFGRRTFWLLLPGAWVASVLIVLPFFGWDGDVLSISLAGGVFPIVLSVLFLRRALGPEAGPLAAFLAALAAETMGMFAAVVLFPTALASDLAVVALAVAGPLLLGLFAPALSIPEGRRTELATALGLTSFVLVVTFLTTQPVAGVGIESIFPYYLLAPIAAGVVAVPLATWGGRRPAAVGLSLAYAAATFGTLVGADVLRQPPLYGVGPAAIFEIGGAGLSDLLYLSGLLAAATAYGFLKLLDRDRARAARPAIPASASTARGLLRQALAFGVAGRNAESTAASALAASTAAREARRLLQAPPAPPSRAWAGLGVPPWVEADHQNLQALAERGTADAVDAGRAWTTSQWLVRLGREVGLRRMATPARRGAAFGFDLLVTLPAAFLAWGLLAVTAGSGIGAISMSIPFLAAAVGYPAYAYLYLAVAEASTGTTFGKWVMGLEVTDRDQGRPGPVASLLRNVPKLIPLELVGIGGAVITAFALGGVGPASSISGGRLYLDLGVAVLSAILAGVVVLVLMVGWVIIQASPERQRFGDYLAGTWVLSRPPATPAR